MEIGDYYFTNNGGQLCICKITKKEIYSDGFIFFIKDSFTLRKYKYNEGISLTYTKGTRTSVDFNNWMTKLEKEEGERRWKEFKDIYERILKDVNINDDVS